MSVLVDKNTKVICLRYRNQKQNHASHNLQCPGSIQEFRILTLLVLDNAGINANVRQ